MFFDELVDIARYDHVKYHQFEKLIAKQLSFFWLPTEVDLLTDSKDFKSLNETEQHIFTSNLKRQILLDSIQGRGPNLALLPIVSLPEIETWLETWSFFECIHSRSYTHIIRNIYPNPSIVFDTITKNKEIIECANDISTYYDNLMNYKGEYGSYEHKKLLWLCLNAIFALEGIRFYVSFACSWAFAELKKMEGNAKIIKLIARDENVHLASTIQMLKILPQEDKEFVKIREECSDDVLELIKNVVEQEKKWAQYLFKSGSMIGLNADILSNYVEWLAAKRCNSAQIKHDFTGGSNPLPWTQKWISGAEVQVAPQETEITSYLTGAIDKDVDDSTFKGMSL